MHSNESRRPRGEPPCDELGPDDGIDPRILFRNDHDRRSRKDDRKLRQLCSQVRRAVQLALSGTCRDPVLIELDVDTVEPAPDAGRLRVVVRPLHAPADPGLVLERLAAAHGVLRTAVAAAIRRRRAPDMIFEVAPPDEVRS